MDAVIGLGSNLEDRREMLARAVADLGARFALARVSSLYETDPVGPPQPLFLNAAVRVRADVDPHDLLSALLSIEARHGRVRREPQGPRTLDLDILWINGAAVDDSRLVVPHPRLQDRRFALEPLIEVAPDAAHPVTGALLADRLRVLGASGVRRIEDPCWAERATKSS